MKHQSARRDVRQAVDRQDLRVQMRQPPGIARGSDHAGAPGEEALRDTLARVAAPQNQQIHSILIVGSGVERKMQVKSLMKILAAIDGSKESGVALEAATRLL